MPRSIPSLLAAFLMTAATHLPAAESEVRLITLDPGHFHAGLVQKDMYPGVDPVVRVYAPEGPELQAHLEMIRAFNSRAANPTHWEEKVYTGADFLERMIADHAGNVVVLAGNNLHKTEYIAKAVEAGFNVLGDKPMAITPEGFDQLQETFAAAARNKVLIYDIMTERHEITSILQRELAQSRLVFGRLLKGAPGQPAVEMESVHHYSKEVAGKPLIRPAWFFDVRQQGEAVPDVGTHLVDLIQWECFPNKTLNWRKDVQVHSARRWATSLTPAQFQKVTGLSAYPDYLKADVDAQDNLQVFGSGEVNYALRGIHAKVTVIWNFEAPPGAKDRHFSILRGSKASLVIQQGAEEKYQPTLYVENRSGAAPDQFEDLLRSEVRALSARYPGVDVKTAGPRWKIVIPEEYAVGHEAHFAQVTKNFLDYLKRGKLPAWEVPNMIAKYYTTTEAYRLSRANSTSR